MPDSRVPPQDPACPAATGRWLTGLALLLLAALLLPIHAAPARAQAVLRLRVQLLWYHQAQFAGFYMAQLRQRFAEQEVTVELIEGGPGSEPLEAVQSGQADIAVAWYYAAYQQAGSARPVVNVAQIFSAPTLALACRNSAGVHALRDLRGRTIGSWYLGDQIVVREMLRQAGADPALVTLVSQRPDGRDLVEGRVACATVMTYKSSGACCRTAFRPRT